MRLKSAVQSTILSPFISRLQSCFTGVKVVLGTIKVVLMLSPKQSVPPRLFVYLRFYYAIRLCPRCLRGKPVCVVGGGGIVHVRERERAADMF